MLKNKNFSRILSGILLLAIILSCIPFSTLKAEASEKITLNLKSVPEIDIVLTLGDTNLNTSNFGQDIKTALSNKDIDIEKVKVQAVETQNQNLQNSFSWTKDINSSVGSITIQNNGTQIQMYGNQTKPGFNKIYTTNETDTDIKSREINFSFTLDYGDSFNAAGILLNTHVTNGTLNGYALAFPNTTAYLYKLTNWQSGDEIYTSGKNNTSSINAKAQLIGTLNTGNSGTFTVKTTKDSVTVYKNGSKIGTLSLPTHYGWGFGFFSDHYSHNCSRVGQFSLNNISLATIKAKEFSEVIRQPEWREGSKRFLVNLENGIIADFDNPSASGEILTRLLNEEIHYLAVGSTTNKSQAENFIARNNNNGAFFSSSNYNAVIEGIAEYIKNQIPTQDSNGEQYVLMGEPISVNVEPSYLMKNTQTEEYPQGRWRIDHDYEYYDNNLGQAIWANQWQKDLILTFDKPGKYEIFFENINPEPRFIYVHRRPIASFSLNITQSGDSYNISINDYSYDPDKEFSPDKGIAEYEWKWRETTDTTWNLGQIPSQLPLGKNYIVQLRVKDHQGEWSTPEARYITTDSILTPPVASFNVSPNPVSMYETLTVNDNSYDPAGRTITEREWIVTKNGTQVYKGSTPLTSFQAYGEGKYKISLRVKNDANLWSEKFTREIEVTADNTEPTSIVNPTRGGPTNEDITINIQFDDIGGSGFNSNRYAISESIEPPTSGWSTWDSSTTRTVTISQEGKFYLHIEAKDNAGNLHTRTMGEYHIDKTSPVLELTQNPATPTNQNVVITVKANDVGSGIRELELPDGNKITQTETTVTVSENGTYTFKAIDNAGNETIKSITVSNIDRVPPVITIEPYETNWTNKDITVTAKVDKGTLNKTSHTFTENGSFTFIATDEAGNKTEKEVIITNIDKTPPTKPKVEKIEHKLVITPGSDNESGIDKHIYSINGENWAVLSGDIDISNFSDGNHEIRVKAIDIAGNETETVFNFITEYEKIKDEVDEELDNAIIDDEADLDELDNILDELEDLIGQLPDGQEKSRLEEKLNEIREKLQEEADKRLKEAIKAVELAEATRREPYIQRAKDKVSKLKEGPDKEALEDRIRAIEYVDQDSIDLKDAELAVKLAEATKREPHIGRAKAKVAILPSGTIKENLEFRLFELERLLNQNTEGAIKNAERLVSLAEDFERDTNLSIVREAVERLKPSEEKTNFLIRLEAVARALEGKELTEEDIAIIKATYYVELAETYQYEFTIRKAIQEVEKLPDSQAKLDLISRINAINLSIS